MEASQFKAKDTTKIRDASADIEKKAPEFFYYGGKKEQGLKEIKKKKELKKKKKKKKKDMTSNGFDGNFNPHYKLNFIFLLLLFIYKSKLRNKKKQYLYV